jgi:hypothetical protein
MDWATSSVDETDAYTSTRGMPSIVASSTDV